MTAQLSPHKIYRILSGYFRGLPQAEIAKRVGVDQSCISHYATRFKEMATRYGILAAAEEYGVSNEVESLRNLSAELFKSKLTTDEAKEGHHIIRTFLKLGISPEKHLDLVEVCQKIATPGFVETAIELCHLETKAGMDFHKVTTTFKKTQNELSRLQKETNAKRGALKSTNTVLAGRKQKLAELEEHLEKSQIEIKAKEIQLDHEYAMKLVEMEMAKIEVEEARALKAELNKKNLKLETLMKLAKEFLNGENIDCQKINKAAREFNSLQEAVGILENKNAELKAEENTLMLSASRLRIAKQKVLAEMNNLIEQRNHLQNEVKEVAEKVEKWQRQYQLFESFIAMLLKTSSFEASVEGLVSLFQELSESGWAYTKNKDELRDYFMTHLMGDFIKSFRCKRCGTEFMTNQRPQGSSYYECPSCHSPSDIEPDISFLTAMVSEEQIAKINQLEVTLAEYKKLESLKALLRVPCDMCGKFVTEWTEKNVSLAVKGAGFAHDECWDTNAGKTKISSIEQKFNNLPTDDIPTKPPG